jgi:hypothetical protein
MPSIWRRNLACSRGAISVAREGALVARWGRKWQRARVVPVGTAVAFLLVAMTGAVDPAVNASGPAAGRLVRRACDTSARLQPTDCYWLEVPERRDAPEARMIRLWVAVVHGQGRAAELPPVIDVTGGPGDAASTAWVDGSVVLDGDGRSIVVMDQRGTVVANRVWVATLRPVRRRRHRGLNGSRRDGCRSSHAGNG